MIYVTFLLMVIFVAAVAIITHFDSKGGGDA